MLLVSVILLLCFVGFARYFGLVVSVVTVVSFRWFRFCVTGFSTCPQGDVMEFRKRNEFNCVLKLDNISKQILLFNFCLGHYYPCEIKS